MLQHTQRVLTALWRRVIEPKGSNAKAVLVLAMAAAAMPRFASGAGSVAIDGVVRLTGPALEAGAVTDVSGHWLYRPGYLDNSGAGQRNPYLAESGYVRVPVPQMLSRVRWWLDDSDGFNAWEAGRLRALGFDTEKAEDGWYRLWLDLPSLPDGRRVSVRFDGVAMRCRAYLNGHELGSHTGMFSRFEMELTPHLKPGRNLLAVCVSMEKLDPQVVSLGEAVSVNLTMSKILSLSKGMFGPLSPVADNRAYDLHGIWQPVSIRVTGPARIGDAWFVPGLHGAKVRVRTDARPGHTIRAEWRDCRSGKLLYRAPPVAVQADGTSLVRVSGIVPRLWSPEQPNLYDMTVTLADGSGQTCDVYRHRVGFRTFEVRGNHLFLNGRPYWLRGANQLPYGKNPWDPALARKLIRLAHDGNTTVTRTHCTPWNEAWLDAADEIGMGVSIEGMRPWALIGKVPPPPKDMIAHWKEENENVIRRCRNHPCVLMWTAGNEMLLRDGRNVEKWKILSDIVKQTRQIDPTRPVICSSGFNRERGFYESELRPAAVDDGDADDLHSYRGWYAPSPFVQDTSWIEELCDYEGSRPIIGQEMATGYPDLDTGLPVRRYSEDLMVPQAWVGSDAEAGGDPAAFLEHQRAVTKRLAEQLRWQREDVTAGFLLFSSECWFRNSYNPESVAPYPVWDAVRMAFAPVGLALETNARRFYDGSVVRTAVFITNDDRDYAGKLALEWTLVSADGTPAARGTVPIASPLRYYETRRVPVNLVIARGRGDGRVLLRLRLLRDGEELGHTEDPVKVFTREWALEPLKALHPNSVVMHEPGEAVISLLSEARPSSVTNFGSTLTTNQGLVALFSGAAESVERTMPLLRDFAQSGGTVILLQPGEAATRLFPDHISRSRLLSAEYVDLSSAPAGLRGRLGRFDCKWWARQDDWRAFVASASHNIRDHSGAKALARHVVVHGYIDESKKADYVTSPLVEIPAGKGRFILCELDFDRSVAVDPAAARLFSQMMAWACRNQSARASEADADAAIHR